MQSNFIFIKPNTKIQKISKCHKSSQKHITEHTSPMQLKKCIFNKKVCIFIKEKKNYFYIKKN